MPMWRQALEDFIARPLEDEEWESLVDSGVIEQLSSGVLRPDEVEAEIRARRDARSRVGGRHRAAEAPLQLVSHADLMDEQEIERLAALSEVYAMMATKAPIVARFRRSALEDKLLGWGEVQGWMESLCDREGPPEVRVSGLALDSEMSERLYLALKTSELGTASLQVDLRASEPSFSFTRLDFTVPGQHQRSVAINRNGVLERLRRLSDELSNRYAWTPAEATTFVLAGETPTLYPWRVCVSPNGDSTRPARLDIRDIDSVTSPSSLESAYRSARRQLYVGRYKMPSVKHLRLTVWMQRKTDSVTWKELMEAWNHEYPDWAYSEPTNFGRDVRKAFERLMNPGFRLGAQRRS